MRFVITLFVLLCAQNAFAQATTCVDRTGQYVLNGYKYVVQTAGTTTDKQRVAELERDGWTVTGFGGNGTTIRIYAKCKVDSAPTPPPDPIPPTPPALSITCPPTQTLPATDATGAIVTYAAPSTSGGVAPITTTLSPASGTRFPVGAGTVIGSAQDSLNQKASCSFTINVTAYVPPPIPPSGNVTFLFSNGWQNRTELGSTLNGLTDRDYNSGTYDRSRAWADFGPSFSATNYPAAIVNGVGPRGTTSRLTQVTFAPNASQSNGPDYRVAHGDFAPQTDMYARWYVKYSDNWKWAGADHKSMICMAAGSSQDVYYNIRGNGNGGAGRVTIHVIPSDVAFSDASTNVTPGVWHLFELHVRSGANGSVQAKLDGRLLTLALEAGQPRDPNNLNTGGPKTSCKIDTTYNNYAYFTALGITAQTWFDDVAVGTGGWIGSATAPGPAGAKPTTGPKPVHPLPSSPKAATEK